ncbi:MAG TPA: HAMP domain-containing sensor histidine kinase [Syntrophorhabdaceae bacterium]|nr:HAMP domain-containing sensor histidine kinase [Syntrophorhabdaceae bacterium]
MADKKTIIFPTLLFAIFFFCITATGFGLIKVITTNISGLLKGEGEIVYNHIKQEIDVDLEYLSLLEKSPAIITPNFLNIMISDETMVEDLYNLMSNTDNTRLDQLPFANLLVLDSGGNIILQKGMIQITAAQLHPLVAGQQETVLRMPTSKDKSLFMGIRVRDRIFFFKIDESELELLRKKFIIQDLLDREEKRFNIMGINLYDEKGIGMPFMGQSYEKKDAFVLSRPLDSKFLPGYTVEILISKDLAKNTIRSTTLSFVVILILLTLSGALSTFAIFLLERKHGKKVSEMEKEMEVKERLVSLGRLSSGMAHEIRNPLNAMSLSVQRLKREFLPAEEKKEEYLAFLDIIRSELVRIDRIVEEFLLSTRAQAPFVSENLYALLDEVLTIVTEKAASKGIVVANRVDAAIRIECQKDRLKQAFYNIILNGIEAIGQKGSIVVLAKEKDGFVTIHIKDSGPGIKEEELHRIFEYYYTTKDKGMGVGLPISYMIVKDHGGEIRVISDEGHGATFVVTLPVKQVRTMGDEETRVRAT